MPVKNKDKLCDLIDHDLCFMGVDLDLNELKEIKYNELSKEKVLHIIQKTKLKIYTSIAKSCGYQIADWFQLSFEVCLIISVSGLTVSEALEDYEQVRELAARVGYPESDLLHIMKSIGTSDPQTLVSEFIDSCMEVVKLPYIFISHASEDSGIAEEFANMFKEKNIKTFVSNLDILAGTDWDKQLREEIYKSDELLLILSPKSNNSKWVMIEVGAAWILGKPITPAVMYTNVKSTPEPIKKFQARSILTISEREKIVEDIVKRIYRE